MAAEKDCKNIIEDGIGEITDLKDLSSKTIGNHEIDEKNTDEELTIKANNLLKHIFQDHEALICFMKNASFCIAGPEGFDVCRYYVKEIKHVEILQNKWICIGGFYYDANCVVDAKYASITTDFDQQKIWVTKSNQLIITNKSSPDLSIIMDLKKCVELFKYQYLF